MDRRSFIAGCAGVSLSAIAHDALGESGPLSKIIFPFSAGGGGDTLCRLVAQYAGQLLDRTFIVENRTGGDGLIGIKWVKNASPDGTTILVTTGPTMYLLPMVESEPSFDLGQGFRAGLAARALRIRRGRGPCGRCEGFRAIRGLAQGQPGQGDIWRAEQRHHSAFHGIAGSSRCWAFPMTRVAYRGSAPVINDLIGGHLPFGIVTVADAIPQHRAGAVKILAVSSAERSPFLPDVPTLKESGIDLVADGWYGMWLPAGSSPDFAAATQRRRGERR